MAVSKYQTKSGSRWLAEIYQDGVRTARRGGFKSRREALAWEEEQRSLTPQPEDLALRDVCAAHLLYCENRLKPNTLSYKRTAYRRFIGHCGPDLSFRRIDKAVIDGFIEAVAKMISRKTANKYKTELSGLWAWAGREGYATGNPPRQIDPYAVKKCARHVPPPEEVAAILQAAKAGFERDFLICLLHTAARISEIRLLAWEDVDLAGRIVTLWTSKRRGGNMEGRRLPVSDTLFEVLARRSQDRQGEYVFCDPATGTCFTRTASRIKYFMRDLCKRAGVRHFGAHSLRHYVATNIHDPYRAQKVLGHQNLRTTEIYLHELEVDRGAAEVFERITNGLANGPENEAPEAPETPPTRVKTRRRNAASINSTNEITNEITNGANSTNEKRAMLSHNPL